MRIFIDANMIIDVLLQRQEFAEDALQLECAREFNADFIVSRDSEGFASSEIEVITPKEFVKRFA